MSVHDGRRVGADDQLILFQALRTLGTTLPEFLEWHCAAVLNAAPSGWRSRSEFIYAPS